MISLAYRTKVLENGERIVGGGDVLRRNCSMYIQEPGEPKRGVLRNNVTMYVAPVRLRPPLAEGRM